MEDNELTEIEYEGTTLSEAFEVMHESILQAHEDSEDMRHEIARVKRTVVNLRSHVEELDEKQTSRRTEQIESVKEEVSNLEERIKNMEQRQNRFREAFTNE